MFTVTESQREWSQETDVVFLSCVERLLLWELSTEGAVWRPADSTAHIWSSACACAGQAEAAVSFSYDSLVSYR